MKDNIDILRCPILPKPGPATGYFTPCLARKPAFKQKKILVKLRMKETYFYWEIFVVGFNRHCLALDQNGDIIQRINAIVPLTNGSYLARWQLRLNLDEETLQTIIRT